MSDLYRHHKGGLYVVQGPALSATNGPTDGRRVIIYHAKDGHQLFVRDALEFGEAVVWPDGVTRARFDPVPE